MLSRQEEFISKNEMGKWAEWAEVHGNYYGTSAEFIDNSLKLGKDILLDVDVQGAEQILDKYPDCIMMFIMPPSVDVLRERLKGRGADSTKEIEKRLLNAEKEMARKDMYHHIIINDQLKVAIDDVLSVFQRYR